MTEAITIQYKYENILYNFICFLTNETIGDLEEFLLQKINKNYIEIDYIECLYKDSNLNDCSIKLGEIAFHTNLKSFLRFKNDVVFSIVETNDQFIINNYQLNYYEYIYNRNRIEILEDYIFNLNNNINLEFENENEDVKIVLSDEEISNLNTGLYENLKNNDDECICPISLKKLENQDEVIKLECGHIFCKNELLEWVTNSSNKCPMCRREIARGHPVF